jgi:hypothetical protein
VREEGAAEADRRREAQPALERDSDRAGGSDPIAFACTAQGMRAGLLIHVIGTSGRAAARGCGTRPRASIAIDGGWSRSARPHTPSHSGGRTIDARTDKTWRGRCDIKVTGPD